MNRKAAKRAVTTYVISLLLKTKGYALTKPWYSGIGHILAFHRVCPRSDGERMDKNLWLEITPEFLDDMIDFFIRRDYEVISLDRLGEILHQKDYTKKFAIFTFDDGYADNFTHAYPVFKKRHLPFTIYVTTSFPDRQALLWWYLLEDLLLKEEHLTFTVENERYEFNCRTKAEKEETFSQLRAFIIGSHDQNSLDRIHGIFEPYGIDIAGKTEELALSWEQIERLSADPLVTIGAHTVNHYALSKLPESVAQTEMLASKEKIESHIHTPVEHFSYPFGTSNEVGQREFDLVKRCGFKTATTTRSANIFPEHRDFMECLPRNIFSIERLRNNIHYLDLWTNGTIPCVKNGFKRIVTV